VRLSRFLLSAREAAGLLLRVVVVENDRLGLGPAAAVRAARRRGADARRRTPRQRQDLRRLIRALDRRWPGGPNCYRRVLLELSVDGGAAREPVTMGLRATGGGGSGHAWLGSGIEMDEASRPPYDAIISL